MERSRESSLKHTNKNNMDDNLQVDIPTSVIRQSVTSWNTKLEMSTCKLSSLLIMFVCFVILSSGHGPFFMPLLKARLHVSA